MKNLSRIIALVLVLMLLPIASIGAVAEEGLTKAVGEEYTIRLTTNEIISVVQAVDANDANRIQVGDAVKVLQQKGTYRVNRLPNPDLFK